MNNETDWKEIAMQLAQRVNFAVTQLHCKGSGGFMLNTKTMAMTHWRDYMADGLEMVPGVEIDREMMQTFDLPMNKRKKAQKEIIAKREAEGNDG